MTRHIPATSVSPSFSATCSKSQDYSEASCTAGLEDATTLKSPAWKKVVCKSFLSTTKRKTNMFSLLGLKYNTGK